MFQQGTNTCGSAVALRHSRFGWWSLLFFLTVGLVLEALHGFKVSWYLDVSNDTRRLLLTLGHAHGTLFSVLNLVFAVSVRVGLLADIWPRRWASPLLINATILLPGGFLLGGILAYPQSGDPGIAGAVLAPLGGAALLVTVLFIACSASSTQHATDFGEDL